VFDNVEGWTAGSPKEAPDLILISIFARSARTFEAIVRCLGERGFGEQGLMLNRSLFEDMIDAHWVSLNRDLSVKRLHQHDLYSQLLRADTQRKYATRWFDNRKPPTVKASNGERRELRQLFGKSGSKSWTGIPGLEDRVQAVKVCWEDNEETLLFWHDWVHKFMNEVLHPSAFSLGRLGAPLVQGEKSSSESLTWHFGSTGEWLHRSLHAALWTFSQTIGLIVAEFNPSSKKELSERIEQAGEAFNQATQWESTNTV
jgi:hypothetical protein